MRDNNKEITMIKAIRKKGQGFTLIELVLVLGIGTLAFMGFIQMEQKRQENLAAENAGGQLYEVGQALGQYINMNNSSLLSAIAASDPPVLVPLSVMQSATGTTNIGSVAIPNKLLLPTSYVNRLGFPTAQPVTYSIYLKNNGGTITGLIISNTGIQDKTGAIRYDWGGTAMKKAGSNAGINFGTPTTLSGLNGVWSLTNTDFSSISTLGQIGYRVAYQGTYDSTYLRLDGMYPMNGNLNMGNYNIKNATDISYAGWMYGNNGVMNNLLTGTITNAGNITTQTINGKSTALGAANAASYANNVGSDKSYANFDLFYADCINCGGPNDTGTISKEFNAANGDVRIGQSGSAGKLFVQDIMLTAPGAMAGPSSKSVQKSAWLSDRLPRYVDRGVALAPDSSTLDMPLVTTDPTATGYVCRWTGEGTPPVAKIEVVPAMQWVQGATLGTLQLSFNNSYVDSATGLLYLNGQIYQDQYSLGAFQTYATVDIPPVPNSVKGRWMIYARTAPYNSSYSQGTALAHVYCDYGAN